jgi:hypothetical protein
MLMIEMQTHTRLECNQNMSQYGESKRATPFGRSLAKILHVYEMTLDDVDADAEYIVN